MAESDLLWYKDAIIYEVHVRSFHDSVGDGIGDFGGLTRKLDYLEDLGVTAVWVLPFYPSPLRDDGYDIADYTSVHHHFGKLDDFKEFLNEAHRRQIRVITELVINHTSDQHPWFQRARRAPKGSPERDFYVWSDKPDKYLDARIIFKDFEVSNWSWDPVAKQYYWHRFYSHQPDLNYDNPAVWNAIFPAMDFWLDLGVDGMRLDAIPYLYEREGTNCENLPETHVFLKALRKKMDEKYPGRMFLAEANQWPEDAVAYFGDGDECHMCFHVPVMPRLFMALHQEVRSPIIDILEQTPAIPDNTQWCMFLRNHDELTLEMVTDEERDYMYRAYAENHHARINLGIRHRLAPLLRNDRRRIEIMNALLFSLPGTPVIYYGDEIGMGDNIYLGDRNGVRTPMQWSADRNAGFSRANPQKLYLPVIIDPEYHYEALNVEAQQNNPSSLLWWMKRIIALRKQFQAFGRGSMEFLKPMNSKVLTFIRRYHDEVILVVANLSRFVQSVQLDLREFRGIAPQEMFGRSLFPEIADSPYPLTLAPHGFYWFLLPVPQPLILESPADVPAIEFPQLHGEETVASLFEPFRWDELEALLPAYLRRRQLDFNGRTLRGTTIEAAFPITLANREVWFLVVRTDFLDGIPERVLLPLTLVTDEERVSLLIPLESCGLARIQANPGGTLCHALALADCALGVLEVIRTGTVSRRGDHELVAIPQPDFPSEALPLNSGTSITLRRSERRNTSVQFGESMILKTFRRIENGINPDLEIGQYLTRHPNYHGAANILGHVEYRQRGSEPATLAILREYVPNQGTAWQFTLDQLSSFFERVAALSREQPPTPPAPVPLFGPEPETPVPHEWPELVDGFMESVRFFASRTAELHIALSAGLDPAFAPEPFGKLYQRSLYQTMRNRTGLLRHRLEREMHRVPTDARGLVEQFIAAEPKILDHFRLILDPAIGGFRIRCHGDFHLGQLLHTGRDFMVIDFEGDSARTIGERRIKRSPLRDVAGMVRSFDYAVQSVLYDLDSSRGRSPGLIRSEDRATLIPWALAWTSRVSREYVSGYLELMNERGILPETPHHRSTLLEMLLLEKTLQEIEFELTNRPEWIAIPLRGALQLIGGSDPAM